MDFIYFLGRFHVLVIEWSIAAGLPHETTMNEVVLQPDVLVEVLIRAELGLPPDA